MAVLNGSETTSLEPDLMLCAQEPIHRPGAIQPHGAMLVVVKDGLRVAQASANLAEFLSQSIEAVLGHSLEGVLGRRSCQEMLEAELQHGPARSLSNNLPGPAGAPLNLQFHRSGRYFCIDIEEQRPEPWQRPPVTRVQSIVESFKTARSRKDLCELAVRGLKDITGYDRVMAYRFWADGHGEVIAETCRAELTPYLGQHYPATDIPPQARPQYLRQRVGAIADAGYRPVPLVIFPSLRDPEPLDLTYSAPRSVSPVHRQYMANMGTAASLTVGLADRDELWGMLVCHHSTPRVAGPELRAVVDPLGQVVSLLGGKLGALEVHGSELSLTRFMGCLVFWKVW